MASYFYSEAFDNEFDEDCEEEFDETLPADSLPVQRPKQLPMALPRLPELILITGQGKHSALPGKPVVREAVVALLAEKCLNFHEPPGNRGRLVILPRDLEALFERHRDEMITTSLSQYLQLRYILVPSLLASVLVVPKLIEFYASTNGYY